LQRYTRLIQFTASSHTFTATRFRVFLLDKMARVWYAILPSDSAGFYKALTRCHDEFMNKKKENKIQRKEAMRNAKHNSRGNVDCSKHKIIASKAYHKAWDANMKSYRANLQGLGFKSAKMSANRDGFAIKGIRFAYPTSIQSPSVTNTRDKVEAHRLTIPHHAANEISNKETCWKSPVYTIDGYNRRGRKQTVLFISDGPKWGRENPNTLGPAPDSKGGFYDMLRDLGQFHTRLQESIKTVIKETVRWPRLTLRHMHKAWENARRPVTPVEDRSRRGMGRGTWDPSIQSWITPRKPAPASSSLESGEVWSRRRLPVSECSTSTPQDTTALPTPPLDATLSVSSTIVLALAFLLYYMFLRRLTKPNRS